jgi:polyvinyl alcohol dehydrogenase (cytochrome)
MLRARSLVISALLLATLGAPAGAAVTADWSAYLLNVGHSSYGRTATAITVTNASTLTKRWTWTPDPGPPGTTQQLLASPTVVAGTVYIGANTGDFYAISESTGSVLWKQFVGLASVPGCPGTRGVTSTATVSTDPTSGKLTVYVGGGDRNLYALDAATGVVVWKHSATPVGGYNWASPAVVNGHIYLGIAAIEDCGLIRGGEEEFDQTTGALLHTYWAVPRGVVGASIWTSAAVTANGSSVYVTTGNDDPNGQQSGDSFSMVRLDGTTMAKKDIWTIPGLNGTEEDWGSSPTLFTATIGGTATAMVGACNKNGNWYALQQHNLAAGPVWTDQVSIATQGYCLAAAIWDGRRLFVGSDATTIAGTTYFGSIRRVDPGTGAFLWETGLNGTVAGSPSEDGSGVLAVPTWDYTDPGATNAVFLVNAATGAVLATIDTADDGVFAQPVFADSYLLVATQDDGLSAYSP